MTKPRDPDQPAPWVSSLSIASVGLEMGVSIALGMGGGYWLDKRFGTEPICLFVGLFFGIATAGRAMWIAAKKARRTGDAP